MIRFLLLLLVALSAHAGMPDPQLTPGATRPTSVDALCTTSTKLVRHTTGATKMAVYTEYHAAPRHRPECSGPGGSCYEIDHLISLELGGADEQPNLWPQLYDGPRNAHTKDKLENELHRRVCARQMQLTDAQACIATDWAACYQRIFKEVAP